MDSDAARTERLKAVQMADLGTARREFISTADNRSHFSHIGLEELEASRESNISGTAAFKKAAANSKKLNNWRNLHKTIDDEGSINAQLEGMMHGQSHRAQLNENMRQRQRPPNTMFEFGASQPAPPNNFSNFPNSSATNHPIPAPYPGRGRGGIGGRGRGMFPSTVSTGPRTQFASMPARLDPALDSNNITSALRGAGIFKSRKPASPKRGSLSHGTSNPLMRATKPGTPVSSFKIASPQEFLAQAQPSSSASVTASPKVPSPLNSSTQPRKTTGPTIALEVKDKKANVATASVPPAATPTPSPSAPARKIIAPRPKRVETLARKVEAMAREARPLLKKVEVESPMLPIDVPVKGIVQDDVKGKKKSQSAAGLLLDLGSTPPAEASLAIFSSPSIADLSGIDFPKEVLVAKVEPPSPSPVGRSLNADTIAKTAENAISPEQFADTLSDLQKELADALGFAEKFNLNRLITLKNEISDVLGFAEKFDFSHLISLQTKMANLSSAFNYNPEERLVEGSSSSNSVKTSVASPLSNVARATDPATPPGKSFSEYRSPPQTSSSEGSKERFYDAAEMNQSPRKSVGTEGIKGFETLKVSEPSARMIHRGPAPIFKFPAISQTSSQSAPLRTPSGGMESSIYAKPKILGPPPKVYEQPMGGLSYEPVAFRNLNPANVVTKPVATIGPSPFQLGPSASANVPKVVFPPAKPVATIGPPPAQLGPSGRANVSKIVTPPKTAEPISRVKILGPAPYQLKRK
ncbi:hypothetical protein N7486_004165 [Penicillium sp. IBT 16267x]|nr:hypothetical protein N7486_004165 [Penicillium sp. IBT 16267x]